MALQVIQENILITGQRLQNAPCLAYDYDLLYDSITGDVNIIRKIGSGGNISTPSKSSQCDYIFNNGSFTQAAVETFGKSALDNLFINVKDNVQKTYQVIGGNASGSIRPSFIDNPTYDVIGTPTNAQNSQAQNNLAPVSSLGTPIAQQIATTPSNSNNPSIPTSTSSAISAASGVTSILSQMGGVQNESKKYGENKILIYPKDLLQQGQDTLHITEYNYQPPAGSELNKLFGGDVGKIITEGITRSAIAGTKNFLGTVVLPIPNNIADNNSVGWGADTMNGLTAAATAQVMGNTALAAGGATAAGIFSQMTGTPNTTPAIMALTLLGNALGSGGALNNPAVKAQFEAAMGSAVLKAAAFDVPPETILARGLGVVPNSNLELLFQGPTLREFSFGWRMSPRSEAEATTIRRIIRVFKQGMAARKLNFGAAAGAPASLLGTPNVYKLEYKSGNKSIASLNKFKLCALTNFSVNYAPDGQWSAYDDSHPVSLTIGISFTEIEPIFNSDYQNSITGTLSGAADLSPITENDIGY